MSKPFRIGELLRCVQTDRRDNTISDVVGPKSEPEDDLGRSATQEKDWSADSPAGKISA